MGVARKTRGLLLRLAALAATLGAAVALGWVVGPGLPRASRDADESIPQAAGAEERAVVDSYVVELLEVADSRMSARELGATGRMRAVSLLAKLRSAGAPGEPQLLRLFDGFASMADVPPELHALFMDAGEAAYNLVAIELSARTDPNRVRFALQCVRVDWVPRLCGSLGVIVRSGDLNTRLLALSKLSRARCGDPEWALGLWRGSEFADNTTWRVALLDYLGAVCGCDIPPDVRRELRRIAADDATPSVRRRAREYVDLCDFR